MCIVWKSKKEFSGFWIQRESTMELESLNRLDADAGESVTCHMPLMTTIYGVFLGFYF